MLPEYLEPRRLFTITYNLLDYFPLSANQTWFYQATTGTGNTAVKTSGHLVTKHQEVDKTPVTKFDLVADTAGDTAVDRNYFSFSDTQGLLFWQEDSAADPSFSVTVNPSATGVHSIAVLPKTLTATTSTAWSAVVISAVMSVDFGTFTKDDFPATGTESGTGKVVGIESVALLNGWTVTNTLHVTITHTRALTATIIAANDFAYADTVTQDLWLAKGVGIVKETLKIAPGAITPPAGASVNGPSVNTTLVLTQSSLFDIPVSIKGSVLHLDGTDGDDTLSVTPGKKVQVVDWNGFQRTLPASKFSSTVISGFRGNDLISGSNLPDLLSGGPGNDTLRGNDGKDLLYGGTGKDRLLGGNGDDFLKGGADFDKLFGEAGNDILSDDGTDSVDGGTGTNTLIT